MQDKLENKQFITNLQKNDLIRNIRVYDDLVIITAPSGGEYYGDLSDNSVGVFQTTDLLMQEMQLKNKAELEQALISYVQELNTEIAKQQSVSFLSVINKYNQWFLRVKNKKANFTIDLPLRELEDGDELDSQVISGQADLKALYVKFLNRHKFQNKFNRKNIVTTELRNYLLYQKLKDKQINQLLDSWSDKQKQILYQKLTHDAL